jgi:predicted small lipoprotein YifL
MKRVHTPLAILAAAIFSLAACGDDDGGDEPDTTDATEQTTESEDTTSDDTTSEDTASDDTTSDDGGEASGDIPEEVRQAFPDITDEQFECVNEAGADLTGEDISEAMDVLEGCGVEMGDLVPSDVTMPGGMDMSEVMNNLTPDQLECLGTEGANIDPNDAEGALDVLEGCGVDISDLTGG